jgi:dTDP-4-dehydrorhamnose reductase
VKILVIGASGQVGRRLMGLLAGRHEVVGTGYRNAKGLIPLDLGDAGAIRGVIASVRPEGVICPGGVTGVDWCETHAAEAERVCVGGSEALQQTAGVPVIHFSTDYVFPGGAGPYREEAKAEPLSAYGRIKLAGEGAARSAGGRWTILRTSMVYSWDPGGRNFAQFVIDTLKAGGTVKAFTDQSGSPSHAPAVARAAIEILEEGLTGIWHVAGPEVMTRYDFACRVARAFGLGTDRIVPVTSGEFRLPARRPGLKAGLCVDKARGALRAPMQPVEDALAEMLVSSKR